MFKELDMIIQDHCLKADGPDDNDVDDNKYDMLKEEINNYIHSDNPDFRQLSQDAQDIMNQWEEEMK